jgi:hypothetical protein
MGARQIEIDAALETAKLEERKYGIANIPEPVIRNDVAHAEQRRHRFGLAEDEVFAYFTSGVGVSAQGYESGQGSRDPLALFPSERAARLGAGAGSSDGIVRYGQTIASLEPLHRDTLRIVYHPRRHPWLEFALTPPKDRGTFVWLATHTGRARAAWRKAFPDDAREPAPATILSWMEGLGIGHEVGKRLAAWMPECESMRSAALLAYGEARGIRTAKARDAKEARVKAQETQAAAILEQARIKREEKAATQFRLRMMRARLGGA